MKHLLITIALFILTTSLIFSQSSISTVVNTYHRVDSINSCSGFVVTSNQGGLSIGDLVLVYQAKGALIDSVSTGQTFGNIIQMQSAGTCELARISQIVNGFIYFQFPLQYQYQSNGLIQLVKVPEYGHAIVSGMLTGQPWNGSTGGILAIKARKITLNDSITMTGKGFRGGNQSVVNAASPPLSNAFYSNGSYNGFKGEGIAQVSASRIQGFGPLANGGGGGNAHNGAGGGGSNLARAGGQGGGNPNSIQWAAIGGKGGVPLSYSNSKLFMGGGGGGGQTNEIALGKGGNGGGIILIIADTLEGNSKLIVSDGEQGQNAPDDAGGGGGAGGQIFLDVSHCISPITIVANGGKGGAATNGTHPGGGGGGGGGAGSLLLKANLQGSNNIVSTLLGGGGGQSSGASIGYTNGFPSLLSNTPIIASSINQSLSNPVLYSILSDTVCLGGLSNIKLTPTNGLNVSLQLFVNGVQILPNQNNNFTYQFQNSGFNQIEVKATYNGCVFQQFHQVFVAQPPTSSLLIQDTIGCVPFSLPITASGTDFAFIISKRFGTRYLNDIPLRDTLKYLNPGCDTIQLVRFNAFGCSDTSTARTICNYLKPKALFSLDETVSCGFVYVRLKDSSSNVFPGSNAYLKWNFGDGSAPLVLNQPSGGYVFHPFQQSGIFDIRLIASNGFCSDTLLKPQAITITPAPKPGVTVNMPVDSLSSNGFLRKSIEACVPFSFQYVNLSQGAIDSVHYFLNQDRLISNQVTIVNPQPQFLVQKVYGSTGCITTDTIHIIAKTRSRPQLLFADTINSCLRREVVLKSGFINTDSVRIDWLNSNGSFSQGSWTDTSNWNSSRIYTQSGILGWKLLMKSKGCIDSLSAQSLISIRPKTIAQFQLSDSIACVGKNVSINNLSQHVDSTWLAIAPVGNNVRSYSLLSSTNNIHAFPNSGLWNLYLLAKSKEGCIDSIQKSVKVLDALAFNYSVSDSFSCGKLHKKLQIQTSDSVEVLLHGSRVSPDSIRRWRFELTNTFPDTLTILVRLYNARCDSLTTLKFPYQVRPASSIVTQFGQVSGCAPFDLNSLLIPREIDSLYYQLGSGAWTSIPSVDTTLRPYNWTLLFPSAFAGNLKMKWYSKEGCKGERVVSAIQVNASPQINLNIFPTMGCSPLKVSILGNTINTDSILWIGNANQSKEVVRNNNVNKYLVFTSSDSLKIRLLNATCQKDTSVYIRINGFDNTPKLELTATSVDSFGKTERIKVFWKFLEETYPPTQLHIGRLGISSRRFLPVVGEEGVEVLDVGFG